jgi:Signal peptidase, peptidase S26
LPRPGKWSLHCTRGPGDRIAWLRYQHLIAAADRRSTRLELITDLLGYNTWRARTALHVPPPQNWVGDLMIECETEIVKMQGELILELSKGVDRFQARWDLTTRTCTLVRVSGNQETVMDTRPTALQPGAHRLRFANVDERLLVWVDNNLPFGEGAPYSAPARSGPTEENDLKRPASIGVRGTEVKVRHLKIWRDTYYTANLAAPDAGAEVDFGKAADWEPLRNLPVRTYYVQPGHFLVLGDNSPESSDSRSWGLVPQRLLLGKALLLYYPFSRAGVVR